MQRPGLGISAGPGLDEHVLAFRLESGDGEVATLGGVVVVLTLAFAAAAQLEFGTDLVQRPAALRGNRASRHSDSYVDAGPIAAFPVAQVELILHSLWHAVGQVEVRSVPDGREADIEAPVAADTLPQPTPEFDAEADLEGLVAFDDGV